VSAFDIRAVVNAADDVANEKMFLTVTGTSAEGGDDGEAGRGNRSSGLITPYRPMTIESVAGKNPVSHVGKLYNVLAKQISSSITKDVAQASDAECVLPLLRQLHSPSRKYRNWESDAGLPHDAAADLVTSAS
jgi:S-adenosylmethionine synthetase